VVTCNSTASSITVSWGSVAGAQRYRVSRGNGWASASGRRHVFSNLSASTTYAVRVQGGNTAGWGDSGTADCTTEAAVLPAPTGLSCAATASAIRFSWNAVAGADGYSAKIQLATAGSSQTERSTASTQVTFVGLIAATDYWVSVLAVKDSRPQHFAGVGCRTLDDFAAPVVSCTATADSLTVTWDRVVDATKYRAMLSDGGWTADLSDRSHVFSGLSPGRSYQATVQAGGAGGWGRAGTVTCMTAAAGTRCADATASSVAVRWDPRPGVRLWYVERSRSVGPGFTGGKLASERESDGSLSAEFTGLSKATSYVLRIYWHDGDAWNELSPSPVCSTRHVAAPAFSGHSSGGNTLTVEWSPVDGAEVYEVRIKGNQISGASGATGFNDWTLVVSTGTFHTFTGLSPGAEYTVEIRAGIGGIAGHKSAVASYAFAAARATCMAATTTSVTVSWKDPADLYEWRIRRITGINQYADTKTFAKGSATMTAMTGLQSDTEYWFEVSRRTDSASASAWQPYIPFPHCFTAPSNPTITQCPKTADVDGTVRWESNGASAYRIAPNGTAANPNWIITNANSHTFTNLAEGTTYTVKLQAKNPSGWSTGNECQLKTLPPIPTGTLTTSAATKYYFTKGTVKGVLYAAGKAINDRSTSTATVSQISCGNGGSMTTNQLVAIMLSIPIHEIESPTNSNAATSPMVLSRWDNTSQQKQAHTGEPESLNERLYSHMELTGHLRAHWSPGVGLWQLDNLNNTVISMNHAERAEITKGGVEVAKWLLNGYCDDAVDDAGLKKALKRWNACYDEERDDKGDIINTVYKCYNAYLGGSLKLFENGKLNIDVADSLDETDGGVQERTCRWTSNEKEMACYLYNADAPQGKIKDDDKTGQRSARTPLPQAFVSLTDPETGTRYAVWPRQWPRSSATIDWPADTVTAEKVVYRAARRDEEVRCSPGRDPTPEYKGDCAEGTYKPFGDRIEYHDFSGSSKIVEGWYDDSVPYRNGGTDVDRHSLQVQTCEAGVISGEAVVYCRWVDV